MDNLVDFQLSQSDRMISVETCDLGVQKVVAISFEGVEQLSRLSHFRIELLSRGRAIKASEILGHKFGVALRVRHQVRKFNGIVSRFEMMHSSIRGYYLHVIDLSPPAWLLTLNQKYRIFHDMKSADVIGQVLGDGGVSFNPKAVGDTREYWVQYGESDFDFVSRLWEEEGLFYRFDHSAASCTLIVGDGSGDYTKGDPDTLELADNLDSFQPQYRIGATAFRHASWDFKAVSLIDANVKGLTKAQPSGLAARPVFEYPGRHEADGEASRLATARMGEHESGLVWVSGSSNDCRIECAAKYKVKGQSIDLPSGATSDSYVAMQVHHSARDTTLTPFDAGASYANQFLCLPADFDFRPPRITPRPYVRGPQTATVTDTPDEFGRAKVKFHWDENDTSRWVRVAQNWAYNAMGTQFFPRVDSEVVVEFLSGDPDHPIIVGMVYNGKNKPPFAVPDNKTQSGIRGANWGDPGTADVSNELRFEDKAGAEEIYTHAQKDYRRVVKHDDLLTVETGDRTLKIEQGNVSETVSQGNHTTDVAMGDHALKVDAGKASTDAAVSITLTVGGSSITIDQSGVTIKGMNISVEGDAQVDVKAPMTTVNGDGMLTLKGGVTMIN